MEREVKAEAEQRRRTTFAAVAEDFIRELQGRLVRPSGRKKARGRVPRGEWVEARRKSIKIYKA